MLKSFNNNSVLPIRHEEQSKEKSEMRSVVCMDESERREYMIT